METVLRQIALDARMGVAFLALDLRTIYVVASLTLVVLGMIQLAAYATGRFQRWPLWWGASNVLTGIGCFCIGLRDLVPDLVSIDLGNVATMAGYILMFVAIRVFAGGRVDLRLCFLAVGAVSLAMIFLFGSSADAMGRVAFGSAISCLVDLAVLREGWCLARREKLYSAWILVALYAPTAAIFAVRGGLALTGDLGGPRLFEAGGQDPHVWLALFAVMFLMLRSMVMLMLAAERSHCELSALALRDPLTGLLNRAGLARAYQDFGERPLALLFDIDHFKTLNDRHGHAAGDDALRLFAETATARLRAGDLLCRLGGDEFVAILEDASLQEGALVADRIRTAFAEAVARRADLSVPSTLSIGVAGAASTGMALEALLQSADAALYQSKREGRNRVAVNETLSVAA